MRKWIFRAALFSALVVFLLIVAALLLPQKVLCVDSGPVKGDVLVVLGGGIGDRPTRAAELFKEQAAPRVIISGAGDDEVNRRCLIQLGVPPSAIQMKAQIRLDA